MQPKSNNNASKRQYSQQQHLPELTATSTTTTNSLPQRTPIKVIKSKKPLCQFRFYLDICDHQLTKRIEEQIKVLGGVLEFFLNASVTHFITDKTQTVSKQQYTINNNSQPGTPQTPATPGTPQTPYSLEANDATPVSIKRTRTSRADAILNRARRQSTTASALTRTATHVRDLTPVKSTFTSDANQSYIVWQIEDALRFFKKVQFELRQYLESPKDRHKTNININKNSSLKTKLVEPICLKGNFIKIEPLKRNYRPYYQLFKKPIEWPKIELKRDDGAFRLSPKKQLEEQIKLDPPKMTRKSRSRSSQHRPLPATVQALKKHTIEGSPKASAGIQRNSKLNAYKEVKESSDKQCGVCEICKIEYDTLSIHLTSKDHEYFAKNAQNFIALDSLINASADVTKFLEENKKMELEEMEVDEDTNTEASALDPLNNPTPTPTLGLVEEKRHSSGAYKTPSPTLREKSKRITKGKHSSEKFQKTDFTATTTTTSTAVTTKSTKTSPTKPTVPANRSPEKRQTSSILELQNIETRKTISYPSHAITRKKPTSVLALSPPIRPMMLPQSPLYKVVETSEMRTPKRKVRMGAGEDAHVVDSPSLIVKFQKVRATELERLNGEAESFMFRKQPISSELPTDQDRQTTSDTARVSISSVSLDSTSESLDVDIENLEKPLGQKAIAKAKRRKVSVTKSKRSFPNAPIQPEIQLNSKTANTKRLSNIATTTTATVTARTTTSMTAPTTVSCFALPEATRKSSRTATAIVTAATTSSLLQAAVDAARQNNSRRRAANSLPKNAEQQQLPFTLETLSSKANTVQQAQLAIRTRRTVVKLEDRMGEAPIITSTRTTTNPRIKIKMESQTPKTNAIPQTPELSITPTDDLNMLDFEVFDDDEDIDNDDVNDEDFKVRKRNRKPSFKATNISTNRRPAIETRRRRICETVIKQEHLTEVETDEDAHEEVLAEDGKYERQIEQDDMKYVDHEEEEHQEESKQLNRKIPEVINTKTTVTKRKRRKQRVRIRRRRRCLVPKLDAFQDPDEEDRVREEEPIMRCSDNETSIAGDKRLNTPEKVNKSKIAKEQKSSPENVKTKLDASLLPVHLFDYTQSEHINNLQYAFERLPIADHWYRVFARQDSCEEKYFEYFGSTKYRKLPYELGPIALDTTLNGTCCKLCSTKVETKQKVGSKIKTDNLDNEDVTRASITSTAQHNEVSTSTSAYLHKHKKLHLLQRYRKEQQDLLLQQQQQEQQQQKQDKATQVEKIEGIQLEINPAAVGTTATTTGVSAAITATKINSKASTPDFENVTELPRNRAGSTHSTASSCASSSATLNKKPFRNKHLNKAAFLSLELPPRKSPREHASTLALVSCIIKQRQDSLSKNNSETDEPPITPTTPILPIIKQEGDSTKTNGELDVGANADEEEKEEKQQLLDKPQYQVLTKEELETEQQSAMVAEREKTPSPQLQPQQQPGTVSELPTGLCSPRTTRSTAATPIEEMRFATEISETVKRMRRGQNKYDYSPPFATIVTPQVVSSTQKTTETIAQPTPQITPRKRGRPPKDKSAIVAKLAMSILPYKRRGAGGMPVHLLDPSSSNRSNTPNSNRSSIHRPTYKRRGRPSLLQKLAFNNTHSTYGLSPAIRKTGSKKGVLEFEVDTSALKALEIATQHTNVSHLEWEIDKYLQLSCKDYDVNLDIANITTSSGIDVNEDVEENIKSTTATVRAAQRVVQTPPFAQTPPPTDYFSSDFDLCDLLATSDQFSGACAAYSAQPEGKRRAYSVYSTVAFENYFRKRRSNKKNRTGWPNTQRRRVGTRDQRKTNFLAVMEQAAQVDKEETLAPSENVTRRESGVMTPPDSEVDEHESAKTTASLENAEDYEGADSTEMDVAESVQDEEEDDDANADVDVDASAGPDADAEDEDEEIYADAEGEDEADADADADAETLVDFIEDTCSQDNADVGIEADEEDTEDDDDDDVADVMTVNNDNANVNDDDAEDAEDDLDQESQNDDNDADDDNDDAEEEEYEEAAIDADEVEDMDDDEDDDEEEEDDQIVANDIFHKTIIAKTTATVTTTSAKRTRRNTSAAISPQKLNNANLLTVPNTHNNVTSTPTNHLLRALRRTPQLNGSLGSCISPSEKAGDNSDIFTVSSDGLDTDLDLSNQHAQLKNVADDEQTTNELQQQQQCPHHGTPKRKLDITKYAPKNTSSTCAAEAATAAVKSLAISQFLKKEVRVTCRRIRAPFRRFRFRR